jgi:hypothetical protein
MQEDKGGHVVRWMWCEEGVRIARGAGENRAREACRGARGM